ncbi:MAG: hypothetical protein B6D41_20595 [Chloroflexi bacterium UTCFX4]|jgi:uncharacterized membrane protein (DUF2068 family)|nr:MAG: hypothetical protein B6D41_20595 [Chloroflexi bacterium UTCFX4]
MAESTSEKRIKRPIVVAFVCLWIFLAALVDLFYGGLLFASTDFIAKPPEVQAQIEQARAENLFLDDQLVDAAEGALYMILGMVQVVLGIGFWQLKRWAWVGVMSWQALSLMISLADMLNGDNTQSIVSLMLAILLVFLLNQSNVRQIFGVLQLTNESVNVNTSFRSFDRD